MTKTTIVIEHENTIDLIHSDDRQQKMILRDYMKKLTTGAASASVTVTQAHDKPEAVAAPAKKVETVLKKATKAVSKK